MNAFLQVFAVLQGRRDTVEAATVHVGREAISLLPYKESLTVGKLL